jgi:hypothetical protein
MSMNGLFFPILSLQKPDNAFISEAVLSAMPSIRARLVLDAPIDKRNMGITEYTILTDVSVRKLVRPVNRIFLLNPKKVFSSFLLMELFNYTINNPGIY